MSQLFKIYGAISYPEKTLGAAPQVKPIHAGKYLIKFKKQVCNGEVK
jgi:hypothetical protein